MFLRIIGANTPREAHHFQNPFGCQTLSWSALQCRPPCSMFARAPGHPVAWVLGLSPRAMGARAVLSELRDRVRRTPRSSAGWGCAAGLCCPLAWETRLARGLHPLGRLRHRLPGAEAPGPVFWPAPLPPLSSCSSTGQPGAASCPRMSPQTPRVKCECSVLAGCTFQTRAGAELLRGGTGSLWPSPQAGVGPS